MKKENRLRLAKMAYNDLHSGYVRALMLAERCMAITGSTEAREIVDLVYSSGRSCIVKCVECGEQHVGHNAAAACCEAEDDDCVVIPFRVLGAVCAAEYIDFHLAFFADDPDHSSEHPHEENVDWLQQYTREDGAHYDVGYSYLVELICPGNEDYPIAIWELVAGQETPANHIQSMYRLVWFRE
jgi:hypothetical protein